MEKKAILIKIRNFLFSYGLIFLAIICVAFFLRFYRLRDYIIFLGDQGRDVWIAKQIIIDKKFTLLGPVASVGGFYLGPFYYYLIIPFLALSFFDPIGPAMFVAFIGVMTTILIFFFIKKNFSIQAAIFSAFIYAISPVLVQYNRFSWNPNVIPFFSTIFFIILYLALEKNKKIYFLIAGILLGILFQLHYLAFIYLPTVVACVFLAKINLIKKIQYLIIFCFGTIIGWSPFIAYEFRHSYQNLSGLISFMSRKDASTVGLDLSRLISTFKTNSALLIYNLFHFPSFINSVVRIVVVIYLTIGFFSKNSARRLLCHFFAICFLGLLFYKGKMEPHYFNIIYVFLVFAIADIFGYISRSNFVLGIFLIVVMIYFAFPTYFFHQESNKQLDQTIDVSRFIINKVGKDKFNFALITNTNSDHAYRYFFDLWGNKSIEIIPQDKTSIAKILIVLCEPLTRQCDPRGNPLWEIAGFGKSEIVNEWEYGVYKLYKLQHLN